MLRSIFLLKIIFFTAAQCGTEITISGEIIFEGGAPDCFPEPSLLSVDFEDTTLQDMPPITMETFQVELNDYRPGVPLKYSITTKIPESNKWPTYEVSAVINVGWIPDGYQWIRIGDYLSDTVHRVFINPVEHEYIRDIRVVHYTR